jgi:hypothetical protein
MTDQLGNETLEDVNEAFDLLRNARRRGVLYVLKRNGRMSVHTIARRIAEWQSEGNSSAPDTESIETSLVHAHLPKLDDAGVIEYDRDEEAVELDESARDLDPLLRCTREREPGFHTFGNPQPSNV